MAQMNNSEMLHAMTIDVEDYFQVSALAERVKPEDWKNWPSRVEANTGKLLDLFAKYDTKATFFVLGWVAEHYPQIVKQIVEGGHEVASHGYSHQLIYRQSPDVFHEETRKSKSILEQQAQTEVLGYRAASYSITQDSLWALDILGELGFSWDSSVFPVKHDRYGMPGTPSVPYDVTSSKGYTLREYPLTVAHVLGQAVPAAGGGYFRQYPYALSKYLFGRASRQKNKNQIFYLHPWEIDPEQPVVEGLSRLSRFRHYTRLGKCHERLERLLQDFRFTSMAEAFKNEAEVPVLDLRSTAANS